MSALSIFFIALACVAAVGAIIFIIFKVAINFGDFINKKGMYATPQRKWRNKEGKDATTEELFVEFVERH